MKEEVDVLGFPSLIVRTVAVDVKQHWTMNPIRNTTESKKIESEWPFSDPTFHPSIDNEITDLSLPPDWQAWWALSNQRLRTQLLDKPAGCPSTKHVPLLFSENKDQAP